MTTSPTQTRVPLRLQLADGPDSGTVGGGWWPQSRDLQTEAADLVDHFPAEAGRIQRLLFSRPDWDTLPDGGRLRAVQAERGRVKVGSFPGDDTTMMVLQLASGRRLRLQVVQGDAEPVAAQAAMDAAAAGQATSASA
ncbi:MAG: hypothetical protein JWN91_2824 [Nocardioides sp.]|jgi:hypothetical protein|nr:hypothetical protein [Nocardioides sp.]